MGAVEFLVAVEAINLLGRQDFLEPSLKDLGAGDRPIRALDLPSGSIARDFSNPQVHIGMAGFMGDANDLFQAWRTILRRFRPWALDDRSHCRAPY